MNQSNKVESTQTCQVNSSWAPVAFARGTNLSGNFWHEKNKPNRLDSRNYVMTWPLVLLRLE